MWIKLPRRWHLRLQHIQQVAGGSPQRSCQATSSCPAYSCDDRLCGASRTAAAGAQAAGAQAARRRPGSTSRTAAGHPAPAYRTGTPACAGHAGPHGALKLRSKRAMTTPGNGDGPGPAGPAADDLLAPAPGLPVLNAAYTVRPRRRVFPGRPDQVRHARRFVERALDGCPVTDTAVLLTSELASNAVQHTATRDGGSFEVIACRALAAAAVAVIDDGAATDAGATRGPSRGPERAWPRPRTSRHARNPVGPLGPLGVRAARRARPQWRREQGGPPSRVVPPRLGCRLTGSAEPMVESLIVGSWRAP